MRPLTLYGGAGGGHLLAQPLLALESCIVKFKQLLRVLGLLFSSSEHTDMVQRQRASSHRLKFYCALCMLTTLISVLVGFFDSSIGS